MLVVDSIFVSFGAVAALQGIAIKLCPGEVVCVLGPNGAGKTTLIKAISGQVFIERGSVMLDGLILSQMPAFKVTQAGIIQCPEGRQLFNTLTVADNLRLGASRLGVPFTHLNDQLDFIFELFPVVKERWHQRAGTLSGGEQQMVAFARSLIAKPRVLLLDEPSLGLAPKVAREVFSAIGKIAREEMSIVVVEQNARAALEVAERGYILRDGRVQLSGTTGEIQNYLREHPGYLG